MVGGGVVRYRRLDPMREAERELFRLRTLLGSVNAELTSVKAARDRAQLAVVAPSVPAPDLLGRGAVVVAGLRFFGGLGAVVGTWLASRGWGVLATVPVVFLLVSAVELVLTAGIMRFGDVGVHGGRALEGNARAN